MVNANITDSYGDVLGIEYEPAEILGKAYLRIQEGVGWYSLTRDQLIVLHHYLGEVIEEMPEEAR